MEILQRNIEKHRPRDANVRSKKRSFFIERDWLAGVGRIRGELKRTLRTSQPGFVTAVVFFLFHNDM